MVANTVVAGERSSLRLLSKIGFVFCSELGLISITINDHRYFISIIFWQQFNYRLNFWFTSFLFLLKFLFLYFLLFLVKLIFYFLFWWTEYLWFYLLLFYFWLNCIFPLSLANCAILHPFFLSDFAPYLFVPFLILNPTFVFNCTFAPYLFADCVILHPYSYFLSDFRTISKR